jgi:hypothetical protein
MGDKSIKRFLPSFLILVFQLMSQWKRNFSHNNNIRKIDKTAEQLGTIEHMLVRLEKKIQYNRDLVDKLKFQLIFSMAINLVLLLLVLLKLFGLI